MSYQFDSRVRYSEIGPDRKLSLNSLVNYFQDCSTFHSEEVGLGMESLEKRQRIWVLSSWQIVIDRLPVLGEDITIKTWPYDFKGFYGSRNFILLDKGGANLAYANSLWIFMDITSGHPVKIDEGQSAGYQLEERFSMDYAPRKVRVPDISEEMTPFAVRKLHLDTNLHVNNGQYILMGQEYLPQGFVTGQIRAEYKKSAKLGDVIIPMVHTVEQCVTVALCDEGYKPYAVIEFTKK